LATMNTRLSAAAAEAAAMKTQAKTADMDRMLHRTMRGSPSLDKPK